MGLRESIRRRGMQTMSIAPVPTEQVTYGPVGYKAFAPGATPNTQVGAWNESFLTPMGIAWPGVQMLAGVEGLNPRWMIYTANPNTPYNQQTVQGNANRGLLLNGGKPGAILTPSAISGLLAASRAAQTQQAQATAAGLLGW